MSGTEIVVAEAVPSGPPAIAAGDLTLRYLGATVEVQASGMLLRGKLKEVEHGSIMLGGAPRVKLWLDLGRGGFLHPTVAPETPVLILEEAERE